MAEKIEKKPEKTPKPAKTEKPKDEDIFKIKTMTDGDFRLPSKLRERVAFGNHTELTVKVLQIEKGRKLTIEFTRANWNK